MSACKIVRQFRNHHFLFKVTIGVKEINCPNNSTDEPFFFHNRPFRVSICMCQREAKSKSFVMKMTLICK